MNTPSAPQASSVTFGEAIALGFKNYANFNGRASKSEFWWFFLFVVLASAVGTLLSENLGILTNLVTLLPFLAVTTRRLHDTDRSVWFQLLYFIPVLGVIVVYFFCAQDAKDPNRFTGA